jgi:hypothetical protein
MKKIEAPAPYCCGEPMQPTDRYIEKEVTYRIWECNFCHKKSTLVA